MRRLIPFLIVAVGLAALAIDLLPLNRPLSDPPARLETKLGLDLQGGLRGEYQAFSADGRAPAAGDMSTIRSIIENRVNSTGVAEPQVFTQGSDRVVVEIPGVSDVDQVRKLIGSTGRLDFVPLPTSRYGNTSNPGPQTAREGDKLYEADPQLTPLFSGDQLASAAPAYDSQTGERAVSFTLKSEGSRLFGDYTSKHVGEFFAIVLDGSVISAPSIREPITGGQGQITGSFTAAEMNNLVTVLKFGALPLQLREVSFTQISATLGADFLRDSILAGAIGIGLVFIFMLVYYRLPGLIACLALLFYAALVLAIFRLIPVTLTLAGVAAFVLSIGMAVDANILIFERMKEELRAGKTIQSAIEAGFNRAWNSIFDSNVSSLITASLLYYFGSPVIKGFALVFIIGVLCSMFTAVTLSRQMLRWVVRQPWARRARLFGVHEDEFTLTAPRARREAARI